MDDILQGCIRVGSNRECIELHTHSVYNPNTRNSVMPGPGEMVLVVYTYEPGLVLTKAVSLYKGDPQIDYSSPGVMLYDGCMPT